MNTRLPGALLAALALMMVGAALHAQPGPESPFYVRVQCNGTSILKQTRQTLTFLNSDATEVCHEITVQCRNAPFFEGWLDWDHSGTRSAVRWYAAAVLEQPFGVGVCGDVFREPLNWLLIPERTWNTSCTFLDGSEFKVSVEEVEAANCHAEG